MLSNEWRELLKRERGICLAEVCDRCDRLLGPVRFTMEDGSGVWCSRECRNGKEAHAPGTCKHCHATLPKDQRRGAMYCDDACKQAAHRSRANAKPVLDSQLSVTIPPISVPFCSISEPGSYPLAGSPKTAYRGQRRASIESLNFRPFSGHNSVCSACSGRHGKSGATRPLGG